MRTKFALCAMLVSIASTIAAGQQVSVNYDHNATFSQYHTCAWGSNNANQIRNSILAQVAQQDINAAMQDKGLQIVQESQNPDLILTANGGLRQQTSWSAWGMRGIGGGMGDYEKSTAVWNLDCLALIALHRVVGLYHRASAKEEQVRM